MGFGKNITNGSLWLQGLYSNVDDSDLFGVQTEYEVKVLSNPVMDGDRVTFRGRIIDDRMAHEVFLDDPCDESTASDVSFNQAIANLHSLITIKNPDELAKTISRDDIIIVSLDAGDNDTKYNLQNAKFVRVYEKFNTNRGTSAGCTALKDLNYASAGAVLMGAILGMPNVPYKDISKNQKSYYHGRLVLNGRLEEGYVALDDSGEVIVDSSGNATFVDMSNEEPIVVSPWTEENDYYVPKVHNLNKQPTRFIKELIEPFQKLCLEFYNTTGKKIVINDSYRSFERQVYLKNHPKYGGGAATPGTSDHGWGVAFDVNGTNEGGDWGTRDRRRYDSKVYKALTALSNTSGFFNPI